MSLGPFVGHQEVRTRLQEAIAGDRLPQVLLVTGPAGVGKQRLALWLAQALFCTGPHPRPCGQCKGCLMVDRLSHPDLHWVVPVLRPKAAEVDRQADEVAEMLEGVMADRRKSPLWTAPDGMASHGVASARLLQRHASLTPVEGGWRVFIIGRADRLVPQESSQHAANSLLKLLEEPPARSLFVLTTAEPGLVLPTIRSRAMPVRLGRLSQSEVKEFFTATRPELATDSLAERSAGSIGAVLGLGDVGSGKASVAASDYLAAVGAGPATAMERALRQGPWQARGDFTALLDALAQDLSSQTRRALAPGARVPTSSPASLLAAVDRVMETRERAQGNVNPQLLLAVLANELATLGAA